MTLIVRRRLVVLASAYRSRIVTVGNRRVIVWKPGSWRDLSKGTGTLTAGLTQLPSYSDYCLTPTTVSLQLLSHSNYCLTPTTVSLPLLSHSNYCLTPTTVSLPLLSHSNYCLTPTTVSLQLLSYSDSTRNHTRTTKLYALTLAEAKSYGVQPWQSQCRGSQSGITTSLQLNTISQNMMMMMMMMTTTTTNVILFSFAAYCGLY